MTRRSWQLFFALMLSAMCAGRAEPPRPPGPELVAPATGPRIAWHGTWERGLAEAQRLERPIFLLAAAPHCHGVPGIW
ncbi:MAG: hypothetical protein HYZ53_00080 [Planctomycetes bacterium]|nr:hypothetical protein [Planctomycetota bacterium]